MSAESDFEFARQVYRCVTRHDRAVEFVRDVLALFGQQESEQRVHLIADEVERAMHAPLLRAIWRSRQ